MFASINADRLNSGRRRFLIAMQIDHAEGERCDPSRTKLVSAKTMTDTGAWIPPFAG
jgi:hypothetical protein